MSAAPEAAGGAADHLRGPWSYSPTIFAAFVLWGISSWLTVNSIFIELPTFATCLPEGWALGSQLGLVAQAANLFPLLFFLALRATRWPCPPALLVLLLLLIGLAAGPLLGLFWAATAKVGGAERSLWLLLLTLLGSVVDCTTSLVYWPFVAAYKTVYITALSVGEGLSGASLSVLGLLQDQGGRDALSVRAFFLLSTAVMAASAAGFAVIRYTELGQRELQEAQKLSGRLLLPPPAAAAAAAAVARTTPDGRTLSESSLYVPLLQDAGRGGGGGGGLRLSRGALVPLGVLFAVNVVENGMVPSLTTFAFLAFPDGKRAMSLSINCALVLCPFASLLTVAVRTPRVAALALLCLLPTAYVFYAALAAAAPILSDSPAGVVLVAVAFVAMRGLLSYTKTMSFVALKGVTPDEALERTYFTSGFVTQLGSGLGSLAFFLLVNYTHIFRSQ